MVQSVVRALAFVLLVSASYLVWQQLPSVQRYVGCFQTIRAVYDQKNMVSKRAYTSEAQICESNKQLILDGMTCFYQADVALQKQEADRQRVMMLAQNIAGSAQSPEEIVAQHNERCRENPLVIRESELTKLRERIEAMPSE